MVKGKQSMISYSFAIPLSTIGIEVCLGLAIGIVLSSLHESLVHQYLGHAKKKTLNFWQKHPRLFLPLMEGYFLHHVVHHGKTFCDGYLVQFGKELDVEAVDAWAPEAFYRLFDVRDQSYIREVLPPAKIIEHLHAADYGLGAVSAVKFASTIVPLTVLVFALAPFWLALGASLPMLFVHTAMSNSIHRQIMHIPQVKTGEHGGSSWLVGSAYMKALERWHWMHHEYMYCNYNLLVLGDFLRGAQRRPSKQDLERMAREGLAMDTWRWSPKKLWSRGN
jgi:hypothetical protein